MKWNDDSSHLDMLNSPQRVTCDGSVISGRMKRNASANHRYQPLTNVCMNLYKECYMKRRHTRN